MLQRFRDRGVVADTHGDQNVRRNPGVRMMTHNSE
jgi:hypothetical protein